MLKRMWSQILAFISHPAFGIVLAILALVAAWKMSVNGANAANGANALLFVAWAIVVSYAFFTGPLPQLEVIPRISWTLVIAGVFSLGLYYTLWTTKNPAPSLNIDMRPVSTNGPQFFENRLGGIKWEKNYIGVSMDISCSQAVIENLDFEIILDNQVSNVIIVGIAKTGGFGEITASPPHEAPIALKGEVGGTPFEVTSDVIGTPMAPLWRVSCPKLIRNGVLKLVIAAIRFDGETGEPIQRIQLNGSFDSPNKSGGLTTHKFQVDHKGAPSSVAKPLSSVPDTGASPQPPTL
jgi:hypothetical protein